MVERLTLAIIAALRDQKECVHSIGDDGESSVIYEGETSTMIDGDFDMVKVARAAIAAMREPSDAMTYEASDGYITSTDAGVVWWRMIDEALKP